MILAILRYLLMIIKFRPMKYLSEILCSISPSSRISGSPLYYLGFASLGYILNWQFSPGVRYPYFFLDWGSPLGAFGFSRSFPFMGVVWYAVGLLGALVAVSLLYIAASRALRSGRDA